MAEGPQSHQGRQVVLPHRGLCVRARPVPRVLALSAGQRRHRTCQRHGAHEHPGLQRLHPQDPRAQAGSRLPESSWRGSDHVPQAVQGIQPPVPARRRRDGHGAVLGRGAGELVRALAEPVVPRPEDPGGPELHQALLGQVQRTARQPGLGRLRRRQDRGSDFHRDQRDRRARADNAPGKRRQFRYPQGAPRAASAPGITSCCRRCTWWS